ncbi:MAG TPA: ubiquinone/menaquinone biosynthesis methyltransferase [Anaerolineae bacterium]|nr:ubiquinone/menaquinone biosynthesis methyltransferase [Anaerolineae bacterium]
MPESSPLPPPEEKPVFVRHMFADAARRYDRMNRIMTLGQDQRWRRLVVEACNLPSGGRLLDVATGTGDIALEALRQHPDVWVVGADFTREMMRIGQAKDPEGRIAFVEADALRLPFPDDSFDAACSGFLMRNVTDVAAAFAEQRRVVKPGGRVVCLEITRPAMPIWRDIFHFYFFHIVPRLSALLSSNRDAYTYLPHSTLQFPRPPGLAEIMRSVGLKHVTWRTMMLGTVALHVGEV